MRFVLEGNLENIDEQAYMFGLWALHTLFKRSHVVLGQNQYRTRENEHGRTSKHAGKSLFCFVQDEQTDFRLEVKLVLGRDSAYCSCGPLVLFAAGIRNMTDAFCLTVIPC